MPGLRVRPFTSESIDLIDKTREHAVPPCGREEWNESSKAGHLERPGALRVRGGTARNWLVTVSEVQGLCTLPRCTDPAVEGDDTARKLNQISHLQRRPCALP